MKDGKVFISHAAADRQLADAFPRFLRLGGDLRRAQLRDACEQDRSPRIAGRPLTVAEQLAVERPLLRASHEPVGRRR